MGIEVLVQRAGQGDQGLGPHHRAKGRRGVGGAVNLLQKGRQPTAFQPQDRSGGEDSTRQQGNSPVAGKLSHTPVSMFSPPDLRRRIDLGRCRHTSPPDLVNGGSTSAVLLGTFFLNTSADSGFRAPATVSIPALWTDSLLSLLIFHSAEVVQQPENADGLTGLIFFPSSPEGF